MKPLPSITPARCKDALERAGFICTKEDERGWLLRTRAREAFVPKTEKDLSSVELRTVLTASGVNGATFTKLLNEPRWRLVVRSKHG